VVVLDTPSDVLKLIKASGISTLVFLHPKVFLMHVPKLAENCSKCLGRTMQSYPQLSIRGAVQYFVSQSIHLISITHASNRDYL
jgi:hypothetical protein